MRRVPRFWPKKKQYNGQLFFGQCLDELTFDYAPANNRFVSLSIASRVDEIDHLIKSGSHHGSFKTYLNNCVEELIHYMKGDIVVKDILGTRFEHIIKDLKNLDDLVKIRATISYIDRTVTHRYLDVTKRLIRENLDGKDKKKIYRLSQLFCTFLVSNGHSKDSIYFRVSDRLLRVQDGIPRSSVDDFLDSFDLSNKEYEVYFVIGERLDYWLTDMPFVKKIGDPKSALKEKFHKKTIVDWLKDEKSVYTVQVRTVDHITAIHFVLQLLEFFVGSVMFYNHDVDFDLDSRFLVKREDLKFGRYVDLSRSEMHKIEKYPQNLAKQAISKKMMSVVSMNSSRETIQKITSVIVDHASALRSSRPETQLITLWSGIETLLPQKENQRNIDYFLNFLIPSIMIGYNQRILYNYFFECRRIFSGRLRKIVSKIDGDMNIFHKFAAIICCEELSDSRDELHGLLEENPLARYRCNMLEERYSKSDSVKSYHETQRNRIKWQILRIYRARNSIIHAGESPIYTRSLLSNLHEYFDVVNYNFDKYFNMSRNRQEVDEVFSNIITDFGIYENSLNSNKKLGNLSLQDFRSLLWLP